MTVYHFKNYAERMKGDAGRKIAVEIIRGSPRIKSHSLARLEAWRLYRETGERYR